MLAFVGPNGAGKTTRIEILEGYLPRDAGDVEVLGLDPATPTLAWRARIGLLLQTCRVTAELTVRETLEPFADYYPHPRDVAETLRLVGLVAKANARAGTLSGGQQRRPDVALALIAGKKTRSAYRTRRIAIGNQRASRLPPNTPVSSRPPRPSVSSRALTRRR